MIELNPTLLRMNKEPSIDNFRNRSLSLTSCFILLAISFYLLFYYNNSPIKIIFYSSNDIIYILNDIV